MDIVFRGIFVFFFLYVLMRMMGRRELSSLEPFDLILLIVLGDAVQQGLTQDDYSLTGYSRGEMIFNKEKLLKLGGVHQDGIRKWAHKAEEAKSQGVPP